MIQGLHFDVKATELHQWLKDRAKHHRERQTFYLEQIAKMDAAAIEVQNMTGDAKTAMVKHSQEHGASADEFEFMSRYIKMDETYRLDKSDLVRLGKLRSAY